MSKLMPKYSHNCTQIIVIFPFRWTNILAQKYINYYMLISKKLHFSKTVDQHPSCPHGYLAGRLEISKELQV